MKLLFAFLCLLWWLSVGFVETSHNQTQILLFHFPTAAETRSSSSSAALEECGGLRRLWEMDGDLGIRGSDQRLSTHTKISTNQLHLIATKPALSRDLQTVQAPSQRCIMKHRSKACFNVTNLAKLDGLWHLSSKWLECMWTLSCEQLLLVNQTNKH